MVAEKPSPPLNPEVLQTLARSVYLSWTRNFDGNAKIKNYLVELKLDNSGWETGMKRRVDSGFALLVDGLKPASTYDMRVYAVNSLGRGDASTERSATTLEAGRIFNHYFHTSLNLICRVIISHVIMKK